MDNPALNQTGTRRYYQNTLGGDVETDLHRAESALRNAYRICT